MIFSHVASGTLLFAATLVSSVCFSQSTPTAASPVVVSPPPDAHIIVSIGSIAGPLCSTQGWSSARFTLLRRKLPVVIHTSSIYELTARITADRSLPAETIAQLSSCATRGADSVGRETIASRQYEAADLLRTLINKCTQSQGLSVRVLGVQINREQVCRSE